MTFLERLRSPEPLVGVELRPPRADLAGGDVMDTWIGMQGTVRRLAARDTAVFLTDNAVGTAEEENLRHLVANLAPGVSRGRLCPFLSCKHTLEYCLWYADRAAEEGYGALTVLGGDQHVGPPRCVPHAYVLRQKIRARHPDLVLGGWANPNRDAREQVDHLLAPDFTAEFFLTQIVSHHGLAPVKSFVDELARRKVGIPGIFGVFYYRSANPKTLATLSKFLPVPAAELTRDFGERGLDADQVCARTIAALRRIGARHAYVSNLPVDGADQRLEAIVRAAAAP
ncbi:MAG: hypothetical protein L0216_03795 [Planctomycetales bacterium]|nr:hypothetical protein [Planctomycetales bacterium]